MFIQNRQDRGFSLIEVVLVLVVIGIIMIMISPLITAFQKTILENLRYKEDRRQIERLKQLLKAELDPIKIFSLMIADINTIGYISRRYQTVYCSSCVIVGDDTGIRATGVVLNYNLALARGYNGNILLSMSNYSSQDTPACSFSIRTYDDTSFLTVSYTNDAAFITHGNNTQAYQVAVETPNYLELKLRSDRAEIFYVQDNNPTLLSTIVRPESHLKFRLVAPNGINCHLSIRGDRFKVVNQFVEDSTIVEPYVIGRNGENIRLYGFMTTFIGGPSSELMIFSPKLESTPFVVQNVVLSGIPNSPTAIIYTNASNTTANVVPGDIIIVISSYARQSFVALVTETSPEGITAQILTRENNPIGVYSDIEDYTSVPDAFYGAILIRMNYPVYYYHYSGNVLRIERTGNFETYSAIVASNIREINFEQSDNLLRVYIETTNGKSIEEVIGTASFRSYVDYPD